MESISENPTNGCVGWRTARHDRFPYASRSSNADSSEDEGEEALAAAEPLPCDAAEECSMRREETRRVRVCACVRQDETDRLAQMRRAGGADQIGEHGRDQSDRTTQAELRTSDSAFARSIPCVASPAVSARDWNKGSREPALADLRQNDRSSLTRPVWARRAPCPTTPPARTEAMPPHHPKRPRCGFRSDVDTTPARTQQQEAKQMSKRGHRIQTHLIARLSSFRRARIPPVR